MKRSFKTEIFIMAFLVVMVSSTVIGYFTYRAAAKEQRQKSEVILSNAVNMTLKILENKEAQVASGLITEDQAKEEMYYFFKNPVEIDIGNEGYFVVQDLSANVIVHPSLEGENIMDYKDLSPDSVYFVQESINAALDGGGFTEYLWYTKDNDTRDVKIAYSGYFAPWHWVISLTAYKGEINQGTDNILTIMVYAVLLETLVLLIVIYGFSHMLTNPLRLLIEKINGLENGVYNTAEDKSGSKEFSILFEAFNRMVGAVQKSQEDLALKNHDLTGANLEIQALYEEMLATEDALRTNYDELEIYKRDLEAEKWRYQMLLKASHEAFWEYYPAQNTFKLAASDDFPICHIEDIQSFLNRVYEDDYSELTWFQDYSLESCKLVESAIIRIYDDNHQLKWFRIVGLKHHDVETETDFVFGSIEDIHEDVLEREKTSFYAFHDPKTGLHNDDYLVEFLKKEEDYKYLLLIGLKNHQRMEDIYGHNIVEMIVFQVGAMIKESFEDIGEIAVIEGVKFAVVADDKSLLENSALHLKELLKGIVLFENNEFPIDIIISGVEKEQSPLGDKAFLNRAIIAFQDAELKANRNLINWVDQRLISGHERVNLMEQNLRKAIVNDEFRMVYQPQFTGGESPVIYGYEALLRWESGLLKTVSPAEFIPLAEEIDFIHAIGQYTIKQVCAFIADYRDVHGEIIPVSINASLKELVRSDYVSFLVAEIERYNLPSKAIRIEMTETAVSEYIDNVAETLNELKREGFDIHLDDFGTGYSSLNQLGSLPVHLLKIDKSFVWKINEDDKMLALTTLVINLAHRFDMKVIAEGVENQGHYDLLRSIGCDYYQGYYFSKPIEREALLRAK